MHYLVGVLLPFAYEGDNLYEAVAAILAPWRENDTNDDGRFDWWQLGGRWTGVWSDYDLEKDSANYEPCIHCDGTGMRTDPIAVKYREQDPEYTCNGCGYDDSGFGPGMALKHPTQWVKQSGDVLSVAALLQRPDFQLPHALAAAPDTWIESETWDGTDFVDHPDWPGAVTTMLEQHRGAYIAVVDIHS